MKDIRLRSLLDAPDAFCSTQKTEAQFDDETWRRRLTQAATFLAWDRGAPVGTVTCKADPHDEAGRELAAMWVDPSQRRSGVAELLIESVVAWAREEYTHRMSLWVAEDNSSARLLYEKCGFSLTGEREPMRPGVDQLRMRRPLA